MTVIAQGTQAHTAWLRVTAQTPILRAEFNYTRDTGPWQPRLWQLVDVAIDGDTAPAPIPDDAMAYYLNVIDAHGLVVSGEQVEIG